MAKLILEIYLSYSQLCIFQTSLAQPFNDWSDRNYSQGFSWRNGSVSFKALLTDGKHKINVFIDEPIPELPINVIRAFRVPFESTNGKIDIAGISDSISIEIPISEYLLQVDFLAIEEGQIPEVNVRLNKGNANFEIIKADSDIFIESELDTNAAPAI